MNAHLIIFGLIIFAFSSHAIDNNNETWRQHIKYSVEQYKIYLPNQYKCFCTQIVHKWTNSETRKDELKKLVALDELLSRIDNYSSEETWNYIRDNIGPFHDNYGKNFFKTCFLILVPSLRKTDPNFGECVVCMDKPATQLLSSCGHIPYCETCLKQYKDQTCPLCRTEFSESALVSTDTIKSFATCLNCEHHAPSLLHTKNQEMYFCDDCQEIDFIIFQNPITEILKTYSNESNEE